MNAFERILYFLEAKMEMPQGYGAFHLCSIIAVVAATILICVRHKDSSEKMERRLLLAAWIIFFVLETYKQLIYSFAYDGAIVTWDYQWYVFPFQLCSTPMYVLPFAALLRNGRLRDATVSFLAFFAFFGGLVVYIYPGDVFSQHIGVNIQTMIHHGLQIIIGVFLMTRYLKRLSFKYFLGGAAVFGFLVALALGMNLSAPLFTDEVFNMFYIGPHFPCHMPILSDIYASTPHVLFLAVYVVGFVLVGFAIFLAALWLGALLERLGGRSKNKLHV